jgi:ABC-2 type transport system ATP-binding protein
MISVRNLTKKFKDLVAVDNISFEVGNSEVFAFLGPNGAGKTTTIKMLTALLAPTSGEIRINGHDPVTEQDAVRHSFGIVFQDPSLDIQLTAYENMEIHAVLYSVPRIGRRGRMEELLRLVQLWERRNDKVEKFSGGMKRRLEIARGLLHHPAILFLDEPTLGLDPQTRNLIWEHVKELNKNEGVTVFLTTHLMEEAERMTDRVAIIDHGRIVAKASPDELKKQTNTPSLEQAFLALTGTSIREEEAGSGDRMRAWRRMRRGGR